MASESELQIQAKVCNDPRLISCARLLGIPKVYFLGLICHLLCKAAEYAEDGDLWRGDENSSIRFIAALAEWPEDASLFVDVLQTEGWLDGWMITDWLKYVGDYLYRKYKNSNRGRLVEIHAKNGREYGKKRGRNIPDTSSLYPQGCFRDVKRMKKRHPITPNPTALIPSTPDKQKKKQPPKAQDPPTQENEETKNPGGLSDKEEQMTLLPTSKNGDFFESFKKSLLDQGVVATQDQLDGSGLTHIEVFEAFKPVLVFHSIVSIEAFYFRYKRCECTPAWWMMVCMDKIHAVYRDRDGTTWLNEGADPIAMTMAAILPSYGRRHSPSEAARQLFIEIMMDHQRMKNGEPARWAGRITGNFITKELELRKGKAGKAAS